MLRLVGPSEKSLAELLYQQQQLGEPIPVPLTLSILRQVCEALDWAHNLRDPNGQFLYVLHRDINPAVIFVGANGATRLVASTAAQANCGYVAPEALVGMNPDPRSDIFSLGVVAHEMLTNRPLFHGYNDHDTLARVCSLPIPLPSTINPAVTPDIEGLVLMALTRDPAYRWQSAAMLRDGLVSVAQRNGLEVVAGMEQAWADLIAGRRAVKPEPVLPSVQFSSPPALPQQQPVVPLPVESAPPPKDEQWTDDTNMETRIQPADPRIADEQPLDPRGPTAIQDVAAPVSNATASTVVANPDGTQRQQSVEDPTRALRPANRSPAGGLPSPRASQAPGNLANPSASKTPRPELAPSKTPRPEPVRPAGPNIANTPARPSPHAAALPDPSSRTAQPNLANPSARPSQTPASTGLPARPFAIPDIPRPPAPTPPEPAADDSGELPVQIDDSEFAGETRADAAAYVDPEGAGSRAQTAADEQMAEAAELPYSPTIPTDDDPLAQAGSESEDDPDDPVAEPPRPSSPNMFSETPGGATQPSIDALAEPPREQAAAKHADDNHPLFADLPAPRKQARKPDDDPLADLPSPRKRQPDRKPAEDPFADLPSPRRKPDAEPQKASSLFEDLPAPRAASGPTNLPAPRGQRIDDSFADVDTPPKAAEPAPLEVPNQRGVALDDLPPAPEKPKPALKPLKQGPAIPTLPSRPPVDPYADMELGPGGPKHERAPTADVEAFVASVAGENPDFSPGPTSFTPPPGGFPAAPPARPFELELGEFTQIGAAPLVQFGETVNETPMQLVGVGPKPPPPRTSAPTLPPPVAMVSSNRPEEEDEAPSRTKLLFVILGALLVLGGAVIAFLIVA